MARIGLTFDLKDVYLARGFNHEQVAELDSMETVAAIENALHELGHTTEQVGYFQQTCRALVRNRRWDMVFNIAEGVYGIAREAQIPALLDAYGIPYTFSDPLVLALTLHKGLTKHVIRDMGIPTPNFAVISDVSELSDVDLPFPLFAKPVAEGTSKGIDLNSRIAERSGMKDVVGGMLEKFKQPVLLETFLPGREFTVGITGTGADADVVAVMEVCLREGAEPGMYSYENKENWREVVHYRLADEPQAKLCRPLALAAYRGLGCRDAGRVDIRMDEHGNPSFLEINPLAGLNPNSSDLPIMCGLSGIPYVELIGRIVASAMKRVRSGDVLRVAR